MAIPSFKKHKVAIDIIDIFAPLGYSMEEIYLKHIKGQMSCMTERIFESLFIAWESGTYEGQLKIRRSADDD
jgi:hypothetical protein